MSEQWPDGSFERGFEPGRWPQESPKKSRAAIGAAVSVAIILAIVLGVVAFVRWGGRAHVPPPALGASGGAQSRPSLLGRPKAEIAKALPQQSDLPEGWDLSTKNPADELSSLVSELPSAPPRERTEDSLAFTPAGCDFIAELKQLGTVFGGAVPQSRDGLGKLAEASRYVLGYARATPPGGGASALPGLGGRAVQVKLIGGLPPEALAATERFKAFIGRCPAVHGEQDVAGGKMAMDIEWSQFEPPATIGEKAVGTAMTMTMTMEFDGRPGDDHGVRRAAGR